MSMSSESSSLAESDSCHYKMSSWMPCMLPQGVSRVEENLRIGAILCRKFMFMYRKSINIHTQGMISNHTAHSLYTILVLALV